MFTGIIDYLALVERFSLSKGSGGLWLNIGTFYNDLVVGESIAVNGVCLTIREIKKNVLGFDISRETLNKTTLGSLRPFEKVNVERALRVGDRLGGHFVTGHVDGTGAIKEKKQYNYQCLMSFSVEKVFTDIMIEKGSVAIDGVSLTNINVRNGVFSVVLIPHTLASTTLGFKKPGDRVNIELDMMGKWVQKILTNMYGKGEDILERNLKEQEFI